MSMPRPRMLRPQMNVSIWMLLSAPLLVLTLVYLFRSFSGESMKLSEVEKHARQLAGPNAVHCGHSFYITQGLTGVAARANRRIVNEQWDAVDACTVAAFRAGKAFWASYDRTGSDLRNYGQRMRVVMVGTADGQIIVLECDTGNSSHPDEIVTIRQRKCPTPRILKKNGLKACEYIHCP